MIFHKTHMEMDLALLLSKAKDSFRTTEILIFLPAFLDSICLVSGKSRLSIKCSKRFYRNQFEAASVKLESVVLLVLFKHI